ncbi:MAG TPA: hypothetical protein VLG27_03225 [Candidatus Saccharimonadia bacterium]|nr:hypothetical protein [Candidatus Saccharimonadia bacterium]
MFTVFASTAALASGAPGEGLAAVANGHVGKATLSANPVIRNGNPNTNPESAFPRPNKLQTLGSNTLNSADLYWEQMPPYEHGPETALGGSNTTTTFTTKETGRWPGRPGMKWLYEVEFAGDGDFVNGLNNVTRFIFTEGAEDSQGHDTAYTTLKIVKKGLNVIYTQKNGSQPARSKTTNPNASGSKKITYKQAENAANMTIALMDLAKYTVSAPDGDYLHPHVSRPENLPAVEKQWAFSYKAPLRR